MLRNKIKVMNICVWLCVICYLFAFFSAYFKINGEYERYEAIYAQMLKESSDFNNSYNYENSSSSATNKETPMFTDATNAIDYSYNNFLNAEFSEYEATGTVVAGGAGVSLTVKGYQKQIKYTSGAILCECRIWADDNKFGITNANQRLFKNGKVYIRTVFADKMSYNQQTGEIMADYSDKEFEYEVDNDFSTYAINKNTITRDLYFKVNYDPYTGQVKSYSASASINTKYGVEKYDERLQREGWLSKLPVFSKLEIHCVIGRDGALQSATINESYSSKKNLSVIGDVNYTSTDNIAIKVISIGEGEPSIAEPKINI